MNRKQTLYFIIFSACLFQNYYSQNFARPNDWKKYRKEIIFQGGVSGFLGDLGGLNRIGTDFSPVDIEFVLTRPAFSLAYRYKIAKNFNWHTSFNYLLVAGDDRLTTEPYRNNRNLNFKSNIFEFATRLEVSIFDSKVGHRYGIKKTLARRHKGKSNEFIAFVGIGGFYFNPKGRNPATGKFEPLYPLHTEGQGLPGGPKQYKRISISIPMGVAWRMTLNKLWCVGLEFNYRKTFTDYIDDVHGTYYPDRAVQLDAYGPKSLAFADPSLGTIPTATANNGDGTGAQRGDKEKDSYMALQVTIGRFFPPKRRKTKLRSKF
ncbi:MAG: hypothetical protein HY062_17810 [Bacteroidetes bacterium]|nr:hypothetical protein [Bacteroidota bacterium]